ncbi:hypothetical protein HDU67_000913 [Dinochytrium kinnereticum]|nr:hypothetical protein HDU67_000913 [Dinochytrium kinnereticum]
MAAYNNYNQQANMPRESFAPTEATSTVSDDYEYSGAPRSPPSQAPSEVQLVPAAAVSSSSGNQQGSSSAASPLSSGGSKRQFWTRRRRIFCFVCLGFIFVLAAVMIPVLIYVILPNIVQGNLNNSKFDFTSANFETFNDSSVGFDLDINLSNAGPLPMDISFFSDLTVQYNGRDILTVPKPSGQYKVSGGVAQIKGKYVAAVNDKEAWKEYNKNLVLNSDFTWLMSADVRVVVFNPITVAATMSKRPLGARGFDNFQATAGIDKWQLKPQIIGFDFPGPNSSPFTGINITLNTYLHNPSSVTIPYGPVIIDIQLPANDLDSRPVTIGSAISDAFTIKPGNNTIPFRGAILPIDRSSPNLQRRVSILFDTFLQRKDSYVLLAGNSQGSFGPSPADRVEYLDTAIRAINISVPFNGSSIETLVNSMTVGNEATLDLTNSTDGRSAIFSITPVQGLFSIPFEFKYNLTAFTYSMVLDYLGTSVANVTTGAVATTGQSGARREQRPYTSALSNVTLTAQSDAYFTAFTKWIADLTLLPDPTVAANFTGEVTISMDTEIGPLNLTNLPVPRSPNAAQVSFAGLNGFRTGARIASLSMIAGQSTGMTWNVSLAITNPSTVTINYGELAFRFFYTFNGVPLRLGTVRVPNVILPRGVATTFAATLDYSPAENATAASHDFISKFINAGTLAATVQGFNGSSTLNPVIDNAVSQVVLADLPITTNNVSLVPSTGTFLNLETLFTGQSTFRLGLANPFATALNWNSFQGNLTWNDASGPFVIGTFDTAVNAGNFSAVAVPGLGTSATTVATALSLNGTTGPLFIKFALAAAANPATPVTFQTSASVNIGSDAIVGGIPGFQANIRYTQPTTGGLVF